MAELQEEVSGLGSRKETQRERGYWNHALSALEQALKADEVHDTEASLGSTE